MQEGFKHEVAHDFLAAKVTFDYDKNKYNGSHVHQAKLKEDSKVAIIQTGQVIRTKLENFRSMSALHPVSGPKLLLNLALRGFAEVRGLKYK